MKNKNSFWLIPAIALSVMAFAPHVAALQPPPLAVDATTLRSLPAQVGDGFELDKKPTAASALNTAEAIANTQSVDDISGVTKSVSPYIIPVGGVATYTLRIQNADALTTTFYVTDVLPAGLAYVANSLSGPATYDSATNAILVNTTLRPPMNYGFRVAANPIPFVDVRGISGTGSLCDSFPNSGCDDVVLRFNAAPSVFSLYDVTTSTLSIVSNGYIKVGYALSGADAMPLLPHIPNPGVPNSLVAPFGTDLDLDGLPVNGAGYGSVYFNKIANHPSFPGQTVVVIQYQDAVQYTENPIVPPANLPKYTFEILAVAGTDQYYVVYSNTTSLYTPTLNIGAENAYGTVGTTYYYRNGAVEQGVFPTATLTNPLTLELYSYPISQTNAVEVKFMVAATQPGVKTNTATYTTNQSSTPMQASADLRVGRYVFLPLVVK